MNHPRSFLLAKLAAAVLGMTSSGCTAGYHAFTGAGLDRPYQELASRAQGEPPPPIHAASVPLAPLPRFHPVPVRPVFLPEGAPTEVVEPSQHEVIPPGDFPPPVDREIPARRDPANSGSTDILVRDEQGAILDNPGPSAAAHNSPSTGWRAVRRSDERP